MAKGKGANRTPALGHQAGQRETRVGLAYYRSGPLPAPNELEGYNAILPNGAERIVEMAERNQRHRQDMEREEHSLERLIASRGLNYAILVAFVGIASGTYLIATGHDIAGGAMAGVPLVSIVGSFIHGTIKRQSAPSADKQPPS